jgi:hypothetical protein
MRIFTYVAFLALLCSSCAGSPDNAANAFMEAVKQGDYEAAKEVSTSDTHKMISLLEMASKLGDQEDLDKLKNTQTNCSCAVEGDKANCDCCEPDAPKKECVPLNLVQQEGEWLVDMSKENGFDFNN